MDEELELGEREILHIKVEDLSSEEEEYAQSKKNIAIFKKKIAKHVHNVTYLWNKTHKQYRNHIKRQQAWTKIANDMSITVTDAKRLWKKAKDSHRYQKRKKLRPKSGASGDDFDNDEDSDTDLQYDLSFLDEDSSSSLHHTVSLGGQTGTAESEAETQPQAASSNHMYHSAKSQRSNAVSTEEDKIAESETKSQPQSESSSYVSQRAKRKKSNAVPKNENKITEPDNEHKDKEKQNDQRYRHIWTLLEKLFEKLDEDKIIDLNYSFVSQTYDAILEKRNKEKEN